MGGDKPWPELPVGNKDHSSAAVVIIGAGISGMCTAIDLIKRNKCHNFIILEKSSSVGGTWHDNKYPGCCCDVWSLLYSYSFEQNSDWTREYPGQEEILDYLIRTASKYNLYKYIRFNTSVESANWNDVSQKWETKVQVSGTKDSEYSDAYTITSDFLVSAIGQLNMPQWPKIDGIDDFEGKKMHTSRWDWNYDLRGKKVAIIGNGATAVQIIPEAAKVASQVTIFQRTPNWVIPRLDNDVSSFRRTLYKYIPPLRWRVRASHMDIREAFYEAISDKNSDTATVIRDMCLGQMKEQLPGRQDLWDLLTPKYSPGCKRILISDDYYPCLTLPNVKLETRSITKITPKGVQCEGETEESAADFDLIVCATGFRTVEFMHPIKITGRKGRSLADIWSKGAYAYNGVTIPDLPNFGILYGPNTNLGHNSIILMIEAQSRYICALVGAVLDARMRDRDGITDESTTVGAGTTARDVAGKSQLSLAPKQATTDAYNERLQKELGTLTFSDPACNSWYKDAKSGLITANWSGTVVDYQKMMSKVVWDDYEGGEEVKRMRSGEGSAWVGRVVEETRIGNAALVGMSVAAVALGWAVRNHKMVAEMLRAR